MPLPVLTAPRAASDDDLLRLFLRTDRLWADGIAETMQLDFGIALTNPALPKVWEANCVREAALPQEFPKPRAVYDITT